MKSITYFLLVSLSVSYAAVMMEGPNPKAPQGKCQSKSYEELGVMSVGQSRDVKGACMSATCLMGGSIQYAGCGVVGLPPHCKFVEPDRNAPYPKCCKYEFKCDDEDK